MVYWHGARDTGQAWIGQIGRITAAIGREGRQRLWARCCTCSICGARYGGGGSCLICDGTGQIAWGGAQVPYEDLVALVTEMARIGGMPPEGYLWVVAHFPHLDLARDPAVRRMIRQEIDHHPQRALLGYAPEALVQAGLQDLVADTVRRMPEVARVSLQALPALKPDGSG